MWDPKTHLNVLLQILDQFAKITKSKQIATSGKPGRELSDLVLFNSQYLNRASYCVCVGLIRGKVALF